MHSQKVNNKESKPFFGIKKDLVETINSLDNKWFVEFWELRYFFMGIEIFFRKKEVVRENKPFSVN